MSKGNSTKRSPFNTSKKVIYNKRFVNQNDFNNLLIENLKKLGWISIDRSGVKRKNENDKLIDRKVRKSRIQAETNTNNDQKMKSFVLKHSFKHVLSMQDGDSVYSKDQEYFGASWDMYICRNGDHLGFYTSCLIPDKTEWSIEIDTKVKLFKSCGKDEVDETSDVYNEDKDSDYSCFGWSEYLKWDEVKEYLIDGNLEFEVAHNIKKVTGLYGKNLRDFDETNEECSDVILNVNGVKFYVSKLTLASHSSFFKSMFLGQFDDSKKSEITLSGIDSDDFQKYLEILYLLKPIDEFNVESILLITDMYDTQIVVQKCEEFLLKKSKKALKKKLEMAVRYNLNELEKDVLSKIKTHDDIRKFRPNK